MSQGDDEFEDHIRSRDVKPPAVLYKYTSIETARIILSTGKLRFQSPLRYNDPFDSQWDLMWPLFTPAGGEYQRTFLEQAIRDPSFWPADADPQTKHAMDQVRSEINALPEDRRDSAIAEYVEDLALKPGSVPEPCDRRILDIRRRMRVLCLCDNDRSILMWSHYADQHRGVVLGFDTAAMENGLRRPLEPIEYDDKLPQLIDPQAWMRTVFFGLAQQPELKNVRKWALVKHANWRYEGEWRLVLIAKPGTIGDYDDFVFPRNSLVEVVSGCRTDAKRSVELLSLALAFRRDVRHYRMSEHPHRFELVKSEVGIQDNRSNVQGG